MQRKVLVVDDNKLNRTILHNILKNDYHVIEAVNGQEALEVLKLESDEISAVLLDIIMPVLDGYETLSAMRGNEKYAQIPVIVTTGESETGTEVKALTLGANDYIIKPYNPEIIMRRLWNTINLRETAAMLNASRIDALTGLYTRLSFFDKAEKMILNHQAGYYTMACFDVDNFKVINDQYGNEKGDDVLKLIANSFRDEFECSGGLCCRISADNFALLFCEALYNTEKLMEILHNAAELDGSIAPVSFSMGKYRIDDLTLSPSAMYDRASMAKRSVKGRYDVRIGNYDESMRQSILHEQEIISEMNGAIKSKQFEVWYQPQFNHSNGTLVGAEALVRWRHPQKGLIPPGMFIPVFERNGFIYELDKYVWEAVCVFLRKRLDSGAAPLPVSVNISRHDIFREGLTEYIISLVDKYRIPVELLNLEVTESAFSTSTGQIINVVKALVEHGFTVEIDDFGSGYSSLNTLKDVPATVVKLDMRFLEGSDNNSRGGSIIESVVRMTKWLGMSVIAEGVETVKQADFLKSIGCSYVQGYLYSKPMPEDEYEKLISLSAVEKRESSLESVAHLDNEAFWNPQSVETLIFNSYVGGASVFEYYNGNVEILRVNDKYAAAIGGDAMTVEEALKVCWLDYTDEHSGTRFINVLNTAIETGDEVTDEIKLIGIRNTKNVYLRSNMRVIAHVGERYLFYCMVEDITAQREAEEKILESADQLRFLNDTAQDLLAQSSDNDGIENVLRKVLGYFGGSRAFIYEYNYDENTCSNTYEVCAAGVKPYKDQYASFPLSTAWYWLKCFEKSTFFTLNDISSLGTDRKAEYDVYCKLDVSSVLAVSLVSHGKVIGTMGVFNPNKHLTDLHNLAAIGDYMSVILGRRDMNVKIRNDSKAMRELMNDTPGGFTRMRVNEDGRLSCLYANKGICDMLGMDEDEAMRMYGEDILRTVHPDDILNVKKCVSSLISSHVTRGMKFRMCRKTGEYITLIVFGRITQSESGETFLNVYYSDITQQRQIEELQQELIENLPCGAGIYEVTDNGIQSIYHNNRYRELVGRPLDKLNELPAIEAVHPDDRARLFAALKEAIEHGQLNACDVHILHGNGNYRPFRVTGNVVKHNGKNVLVYATYVPISEEEISFREMLPVVLEAMMASSTDLSFVKDRNLTYICASRAFANMIGIDDEKLIVGKTDYDIFDTELAEKYRADDRKLIEEEKSLVDYVENIPSHDGTFRYSCTSKYLLRDALGSIIGLYGTGRDITENREAYARLKLLTDNIPGGIAMYSISSNGIKPLYLSNGIYDINGYEKDEYDAMVNENALCLIFDEDIPAILHQLDLLKNNGTPVDCTCRINTKDGGYKWLNLRGAVAYKHGDNTIVNAVMFDITQQKSAELRLEASHDAMELASINSGISFWLYDMDKKQRRQEFQDASPLGYSKIIDNVPECFITAGTVMSQDADDYRRMYSALFDGADRSECTVRICNRNSGKYEWQHIVYTRLNDKVYKTRAAIGIASNVDAEQESKQRYEHELQLRREIIKNSVFYYQLNITTGVIEEYYSQFAETTGMAASIKTSDKLRSNLLEPVAPEYREAVRNTIFSAALFEAYKRGETTVVLVYRRVIGDIGLRWVEATASIMQRPNTGDLIAFLHSVDIDEEKKNSLALETIMDEEIESVAVIKTYNGVARLVQLSSGRDGLEVHREFDFDLKFNELIDSRVYCEDRDICKRFFNTSRLIELLAEEPVVKLLYRVIESDGTVQRKKSRAFYLDKTHREIILIRRDITDIR